MAKIKHFEKQKKGLLKTIIQRRFERNLEDYLFENKLNKWESMDELDEILSEKINDYYEIMEQIDEYYNPRIEEDEANNNYEEEEED